MTVRVYENIRNKQSNWVTRFLARYQVQHQMVTVQELGTLSPRSFRAAVEVDGHLFVDPNEDALRKILHVG